MAASANASGKNGAARVGDAITHTRYIHARFACRPHFGPPLFSGFFRYQPTTAIAITASNMDGSQSLPQETIDFAHEMFDAARNGETELLKSAVEAGLPPNLTNPQGTLDLADHGFRHVPQL